jgi:hypothetical protein
VTGKPFIFAVGADLKGDRGGRAFELALATGKPATTSSAASASCRSRPSRSSTARRWAAAWRSRCTAPTAPSRTGVPAFSLPEVFLGLIPGWGGTQLLPRLIGPDNAVTVIVENSAFAEPAAQGAKASSSASPTRSSSRPTSSRSRSLGRQGPQAARSRSSARLPEQEWDAAVERGKRSPTPGARRGPRPVPALDLIALARTATRGPRASTPRTRRWPTAIMSEELRSGIYAFNLVQKRAKRPVGAPDKSLAKPVTKVGVVGAGLMASQLATCSCSGSRCRWC